MVLRRWLGWWAVLAPLAAQTEIPSETLVLARLKNRMASNLSQLPNYTCLQTIDRWRRSGPAGWALADILRLEVVMAGNRELFSWPGAGKFEEKGIGEMVGGGMSGSGDFGLHARAIFLSQSTSIQLARQETRPGPAEARYDYRVPPFASGFEVVVDGKSATVPYHGSFAVDPETLDLTRLEIVADEIPLDLELSQVRREIRYGKVRLGESTFLLPQTATTAMISPGGRASFNRTEYTHCRQFLAEASVRFVESEPAAAEPESRAASELPPGVTVEVQLETPIDSHRSALGDAIAAVTAREERSNGRLVVPKGAVLAGRIRALERISNPTPHWVVALEFSNLQLDGRQTRFFARLEDISPLPGLSRRSPRFPSRIPPSAAEAAPEGRQPDLLGVATFFVRGTRAQLPRGLRMVWRTVEVSLLARFPQPSKAPPPARIELPQRR